jgi:hypothetical protein
VTRVPSPTAGSTASNYNQPTALPTEAVENSMPVTSGHAADGPVLLASAQSNTGTKASTAGVADVVQAHGTTLPQETHALSQTSQTPPLHKSAPATKHLVNNSHVFLQYQIDNTGPSGVGAVEVYLTRDKGQNWTKIGEDADHKSPIELDLPGEGLFGVSLVVSNGRGFGAAPPAPGDAPEWWIEVDVTKPTAELSNVVPGKGNDAGAVLISWAVRDKNLSATPIDLYYALAPEGPWQPIAKGVRNDSPYRWTVPTNLGPEAYIRLVAHDTAGNATQTETTQPVTLDDMSRPRGRVTGVSTTAPRGSSVH